MEPMKIFKLYAKSVGTSSVSIALDSKDTASGNLTASGYNVVFHNTGISWVYVEPGIDSAATAVYPVDGVTKLGTLLPPGGEVTWGLPTGTTHLSFIAVSGTNLIGVSIGQGI